MNKLALSGVLLAALALDLFAVETKFWEQSDQSDFEKGSFENLSLRSDGRIFLAPSTREIFDSSVTYLWAIASDSKGNLYAGGGGSGSGRSKLFEISRDGRTRALAELDGLEIHAIAVDKKDRVYAATDPDGKVYRVAPDGTCQVFYDPKAKYIWAMAFDGSGNLFIATGDQGEVHRVGQDGKGAVFFRTEETHARSLAIDAKGNLIVGTEPGGLVLRISPSAKGFVLYQAPKREITSVAVGPNGAIYAAGVGTRPSTSTPPITPPTPIPSAPPSASSSSSTVITVQPSGRPAAAPNVPVSFTPTSVSGGSDVYRIDAEGSPRKIWSNSQDIAYAITFDSSGRPLVGTGNRGRVYRIDSDVLSTQLLNFAPTQVTNFVTTPDSGIYAISGNVGKVYRIGPSLAQSGKFESEALDAGSFSYWGRITVRGSNSGIALRTRTGNLNRPVNNWSSWSTVPLTETGGDWSGRIASTSARFLQYELALTGSGPLPTEVSSVEIAYLTKNVAPDVQEIEMTPPNYKFPSQSLTMTPSTSITLPSLGQKRSSSSTPALELGASSLMNYAKGYIGARWRAHDENGDTLVYKLEIRGRGESEWKLLKDRLKDTEYSWDSSAFPDGEYELRVTASDEPSNPPGQALTASLVGDSFLIDNTPPEITGLTAAAQGSQIDIRWHARDARSIIDHAEYSINGSPWSMAQPVSLLSDSLQEDYLLDVPRTTPGEQTIAVRVTDYYDNQSAAKIVVK